jgi:hypothetical protein
LAGVSALTRLASVGIRTRFVISARTILGPIAHGVSGDETLLGTWTVETRIRDQALGVALVFGSDAIVDAVAVPLRRDEMVVAIEQLAARLETVVDGGRAGIREDQVLSTVESIRDTAQVALAQVALLVEFVAIRVGTSNARAFVERVANRGKAEIRTRVRGGGNAGR